MFPLALEFIIYTICGFPQFVHTEIGGEVRTYDIVPQSVIYYPDESFDFHITGTLSQHEHYMMVLEAMADSKTRSTIVEKADKCI